MDSYQLGLLALIALVVFLLFRNRKKGSKKAKSTNTNESSNRNIKINPKDYNDGKCYPDYPAPSPFCDDPCFSRPLYRHREANHEFRMLRMEYDTAIKRHNRVSAKIRRVNAAAKEFDDISGPEMQEVIDLCKKDILDAPALVEYGYRYAAMRGWDSPCLPTYESFRRLVGIYEKQGKYEEAIDICDQAIRLGLDYYDPKISLTKRRQKLIELASRQKQRTNLVEDEEERPPVTRSTTSDIKTTRDELQAYEIIRSMAHEIKMEDRITYKDTKSYLAILVDGNTRKWVCRLKIQSGPRWITFRPEKEGIDDSERINQVEDLYQYRKKLVSIMKSLS